MSYDACIAVDAGCGNLTIVDEIGNMTSNVRFMFRAAMPGPYPGGGKYDGTGEAKPCGGLPGVSGLPCTEALPALHAGVSYMEGHQDELEQMSPANGWGSYEGALAYLRKCADACAEHPAGIFCVSW